MKGSYKIFCFERKRLDIKAMRSMLIYILPLLLSDMVYFYLSYSQILL